MFAIIQWLFPFKDLIKPIHSAHSYVMVSAGLENKSLYSLKANEITQEIRIIVMSLCKTTKVVLK